MPTLKATRGSLSVSIRGALTDLIARCNDDHRPDCPIIDTTQTRAVFEVGVLF
jgi:hypothetical protein